MSGVFGWSLPPGCGTLPGEEQGAADLTGVVAALLGCLPPSLLGVFWTEDDTLIEVRSIKVPAMDGEPAYSDTYESWIGDVEWDDDMGDAMNFVAAATAYWRMTWQP